MEAEKERRPRFWIKSRRRDLWRDTVVGTIHINTDSVDSDSLAKSISGRLSAFEDEKPGTPVSEHFKEIAAELKKIEAERLRDIQAASLPDTEKK